MAHDFYAAADALSNQSGQMSVALVVLQQKLDDAQNTENGIETPIGRSSLIRQEGSDRARVRRGYLEKRSESLYDSSHR